tara:strand:- start:1889 stop:2173 length:285 start_codon:yes stop_codon:yes gene_type:complete
MLNKIENGVVVPLTDEEIAEFNASFPSEAEVLARKWERVRHDRNRKLAESDWVATKASETGVAVSDEWKTYRQALRDVPTQSDPDNITWPTKPS